MIDPWGGVISDQRLDNGRGGVIDAVLPRPAGMTVYGRFGDSLFWLLIGGGLLAGLLSWLRSRKARG